jgi:hypothetical protein
MRPMTAPWLMVAALTTGLVVAAAPANAPALRERLPKDPILVLSVPSAEVAGKLEAFARWQGVESTAELGLALQTDVLAHLGPEIVLTLDLPPLDALAASLHLQSLEGFSSALSRSGLVASVRDAQALDRGLRQLLERWSAAAPVEQEGVLTARVPLLSGAGGTMAIHYAIRDGRVALGFTPEWVTGCLDERRHEDRLVAGDDYRKVFAHLDERPQSFAYVNLPKLRTLIDESAIASALLQNNEGIRKYVQPLLDPAVMSIGIGSTSVAVDGGVRTTHFGPPWMSGVVASGGLLAAMAMPTLIVANDRNKARETLDDMRSIATACDGFSSDVATYPGPTQGWVPIASVAAFLEPMYIGSLPRVDAWDNPILYWSNGTTYRLLSTGTDGQMDQDWSGLTEPTTSEQQAGDIMLANGRILVLPRDLSD